MNNERKIEMQGPFTDEQIAELIAFVRRCDDSNPSGNFRVLVSAQDGSIDRAFATLKAGLPERADRETSFVLHRKN